MSKNPSILIVCNTFPPSIGGVGEYVYNLVKFLRNKYNFIVVAPLNDTELSHEENADYYRYTGTFNMPIVFRVNKLPGSPPYITTFPLVVKSYQLIKRI